MGGQVAVERADAHARQLEIVDEAGPPGEIEHDHGQRFVHGQQKGAVAADAALVAERLLERLAEGQPDVLDGVMAVDVEIAARGDHQIEAAVMSEELEHVIEKADAGAHLGGARAVERERHGDIGLAGDAMDLCAAGRHAGLLAGYGVGPGGYPSCSTTGARL